MNEQRSPAGKPLDYARPSKKAPAVRWPWWLTLVVCLAGMIEVGPLVERRLSRHDSESNAVRCASNLRQIGLALIMYANDHNGQLPASFDEVLATQDITPEVFCCPSSRDTRAMGSSTLATLDDFAKPGHCSYIYLGAGLKLAEDPNVVLAYEPTIDHGNGRGMNVLFADGHVDLLPAPGVLPWIHWNTRPVVRPGGANAAN